MRFIKDRNVIVWCLLAGVSGTLVVMPLVAAQALSDDRPAAMTVTDARHTWLFDSRDVAVASQVASWRNLLVDGADHTRDHATFQRWAASTAEVAQQLAAADVEGPLFEMYVRANTILSSPGDARARWEAAAADADRAALAASGVEVTVPDIAAEFTAAETPSPSIPDVPAQPPAGDLDTSLDVDELRDRAGDDQPQMPSLPPLD